MWLFFRRLWREKMRPGARVVSPMTARQTPVQADTPERSNLERAPGQHRDRIPGARSPGQRSFGLSVVYACGISRDNLPLAFRPDLSLDREPKIIGYDLRFFT